MAIININGIIGQDYTYKQFITDYANAGEEQIRLLIDSPGGFVDEGENIAEFISQHATRFLSVSNSGDVASIAASIFLALPFEKRFFDLSKGVALIHNPMFQPNADESFTALELEQLSDSMATTEKKIKAYISKQTGSDPDVVGALMSINEPLNEAQLKSINFANLIKFQPIALISKKVIKKTDIKMKVINLEISLNEKQDKIYQLLKPLENNLENMWVYLEDVYDTYFIYAFGGEYFKQVYTVTVGGDIELQGTPIKAFSSWKTSDELTQQVAILKTKIKNMTKEQSAEHLSALGKMIASIEKLFKGTKTSLMLTDANGVQIDFPEVAEGGTVVVGDKTNAADGEYVMADGATYVVAGGQVTEIKPAEAEGGEDMEAIKAENAALKAELEGLKAQAVTSQATIAEVKAQVVAMQGRIRSQMDVEAPAEKKEKEVITNRFK